MGYGAQRLPRRYPQDELGSWLSDRLGTTGKVRLSLPKLSNVLSVVKDITRPDKWVGNVISEGQRAVTKITAVGEAAGRVQSEAERAVNIVQGAAAGAQAGASAPTSDEQRTLLLMGGGALLLILLLKR